VLRGSAGAAEKEWQMFSMVGWLRRKPYADIHKQHASVFGFVFLNRTKSSNFACFLII